MAYGLSTTGLANVILEHLRGGTSWTKPSALYAQLHKGNPGSAGTSNISTVTTRKAIEFDTPSGGAMELTGDAPTWDMTATESIDGVSIWTASTSGTFLWSAPFTSAKSVADEDTLTLRTCGLSFLTLAS